MKHLLALSLLVGPTAFGQKVTGGSSTIGPFHPKEAACEKSGGRPIFTSEYLFEMQSRKFNERGETCVFCDEGSVIDSMTLYLVKETGKSTPLIDAFFNRSRLGHDAVSFCTSLGGYVKTVYFQGNRRLSMMRVCSGQAPAKILSPFSNSDYYEESSLDLARDVSAPEYVKPLFEGAIGLNTLFYGPSRYKMLADVLKRALQKSRPAAKN